MRFKINQEDLIKNLSVVVRATPTKPNLPILSNILIETDEDKLKLAATNLEIGITTEVKAKIEKKGKITVPARIIYEFISTLQTGDVNCYLEAAIFTVESGRSVTHLTTIDPAEFPIIPTTKKRAALVFDGADFSQAISQTAFAAASDEGRPALTGVLFETKKDQSFLVATDGYRLSFRKIGFDKDWDNQKMTIPAKVLLELAKIIDDLTVGKVEAYFSQNENQVVFRAGNVELVSRLIEGEFPAWERIVPTDFKTEAIIDREEFLKSVKTTAVFARDSGNIIRLKVGNDSVVLSANSKELGDNTSQVSADIKGDGGEIAFNYRYLSDVLSTMKAGRFKFEMIESLNPGRFSPVDKDKRAVDFYHIIMPVRVQA